MGPKCVVQEDLGSPDCMMAQEEILEDLDKDAQIHLEEEFEEVNLGVGLGSPKPVFISSQLAA